MIFLPCIFLTGLCYAFKHTNNPFLNLHKIHHDSFKNRIQSSNSELIEDTSPLSNVTSLNCSEVSSEGDRLGCTESFSEIAREVEGGLSSDDTGVNQCKEDERAEDGYSPEMEDALPPFNDYDSRAAHDLISNEEFAGYQESGDIMIPYVVDYPINLISSGDCTEGDREEAARDYLNSFGFFNNDLTSSIKKTMGMSGYDMIRGDLYLGEGVWQSMKTMSMCEEAVTKKAVNEGITYSTIVREDVESIRKEYVLGRARIHWFPRYFGKALGMLGDYIKECDIILDVRDARMPHVSDDDFMLNVYNNMFTHKPKVMVFTHSDLASKSAIEDWGRYYRIKEYRYFRLFNKNIKDEAQWRPCTPVVFVDAKHGGKGIITLKKRIYALCKRVQSKRIRLGLAPRPLRAIVLGLPNIGKSALINRLLGRYKTQSYNAAGVTREIKWARLHPDEYREAIYKIIDVVDTPGILPPDLYKLCDTRSNNTNKRNKILGRLYFNLNDTTVKGGYSKFGIDAKSQKLEKNIWLLAAANQIIEGAYELSEAAEMLLEQIFTTFKVRNDYVDINKIIERYKLFHFSDIVNMDFSELDFGDLAYQALDFIAKRTSANNVNAAASRVLVDFRKGYLGPMTLQIPPFIHTFDQYQEIAKIPPTPTISPSHSTTSPIPYNLHDDNEDYKRGIYEGW